MGGRAALLLAAATVDDLLGLAPLLTATATATGTGVPVAVLGRGSNLLVADAGFGGLVITLSGEAFATLRVSTDDRDQAGDGSGWCSVRAGGAVALPVLARQTAAAGLTGLEWAVGVPGSVGGAVRMNAGGHGDDTAATLRRCRLVDLESGRVEVRSMQELAMGYRRSAVTAHQVVVDADYQLAPGNRTESEATIRDIARWRREHQPGGQNAGSVFINPLGPPPGNSAGWLVDAAGLKGHRHGSAAVSTKHANFILAEPDGSADDVLGLMLEVQRLVSERLGVFLKAEVRLLGFAKHLTSTLGSDSEVHAPSPGGGGGRGTGRDLER